MKRYKTSVGSNSNIVSAFTKFDFKEYDLSNGLHCILYKDNRNPIVNVTVGYKIGSKDEEKNKKGLAHFFEHMMFQGSENVKKNEHFNYVMKSGGICNAFTMNDATAYFETMPSQNLEMALWLESDRMNSLNISDENLSNQKSVVIEEKKQVYDNAPYGSTNHKIFENIFHGSAYESKVIGEVDDINSFTVGEAKNFHDKYYSPKNSVLIICGDIDYRETEFLIDKYFNNIKKDYSIDRKKNDIAPLIEDIELEIYDNVQLPVLNICLQLPNAGSIENYALEYATEVLANNKSSRLYKKLVYEKKLLRSVKATKYTLEDGGVLILKAMINPGVSIDEIKVEIFQTIEDLCDKGIEGDEYGKIRNQIEFANTVKCLKIQNVSIETLFNYLYFKDVSRINDDISKYLSVTKQDVVNCVTKFILNKNKLILKYLPKS